MLFSIIFNVTVEQLLVDFKIYSTNEISMNLQYLIGDKKNRLKTEGIKLEENRCMTKALVKVPDYSMFNMKNN